MECQAFKIRRSDGRWFRRRAPERAPEWTDDIENAARFVRYVEAMEVAQQLEQAGFDVKLIGVV